MVSSCIVVRGWPPREYNPTVLHLCDVLLLLYEPCVGRVLS